MAEMLVLPVGIEPTTSPLPRECSTTELRQRPVRGPSQRETKPIHEAPQAGKVGGSSGYRSTPSAGILAGGLAAADLRCISRFTAARELAIPNHELLDRLPALSLHRRMSEPPQITPKKSVERAAREARLAKALRDNLVRRKGQKRAQGRRAVAQSRETDPEREPPA